MSAITVWMTGLKQAKQTPWHARRKNHTGALLEYAMTMEIRPHPATPPHKSFLREPVITYHPKTIPEIANVTFEVLFNAPKINGEKSKSSCNASKHAPNNV